MNRNFLFILCLVIFIGCSSTHTAKSKKQEISQLPKMVKCRETPEVFDTIAPIYRLNGRLSMAYAHTYNSIRSRGDSTLREQIRRKNARIARLVVQKVFPDIELAEDQGFQNKNYKEVALNLARIHQCLPFLTTGSIATMDPHSGNNKKRPPGEKKLMAAYSSIDNLTVTSNSELQLFIRIRSFLSEGSSSNRLFIYVFNTTTHRIPYYDELEYYCDIRDEEALVKVLYYALEKIKA